MSFGIHESHRYFHHRPLGDHHHHLQQRQHCLQKEWHHLLMQLSRGSGSLRRKLLLGQDPRQMLLLYLTLNQYASRGRVGL